MDLIIQVKEIKGHCPVHRVGDKFILKEGYKLVSNIPICMHAIASLIPHYNALRFTEPDKLGLGKEKAYFQCLDPHEYTNGGTVIFEVSKEH